MVLLRWVSVYPRVTLFGMATMFFLIAFTSLRPRITLPEVVQSQRASTTTITLNSAQGGTGIPNDLPNNNRSTTGECKPEHRKSYLETKCNNLGTPLKDISEYNDADKETVKKASGILVDDKHKVIMCVIAKAGCSTYKMLLANNSATTPIPLGKERNIHGAVFKYGIREWKKDSLENITKVYKDYKKIIVVRHPFDRLVSAYTEKLNTNNWPYEKAIGSYILRTYRRPNNLTKDELAKGKGVTFKEFLRYLADGNVHDHHWKTYQDACQPCLIKYDYIAKLETTFRDLPYISNTYLSGRGDGETMINPSRGGARQESGRVLHKYADIDSMLMKRLLKVYGDDFDMFGYTYHMDSNAGGLVSECLETDPEGNCC